MSDKMLTRHRIVSAPSKILLAGGYLVFDPLFFGLVLSLKPRIYALAELDETYKDSISFVTVKSPQFANSVSRYKLFHSEQSIRIEAEEGYTENSFAEKSIYTVFTYMDALYRKYNLKLNPVKLDIKILADNEYYTFEKRSEKFMYLDVPMSKAPKTGLGSSSAFTVSLVAALLTVLEPTYVDVEIDVERIHNLSQIAHCEAQGKIGSGFDIASACFGSCTYSRFTPSLAKFPANYQQLLEVIHRKWDCSIDDFCLPSRLKLIMIDLKAGSSSSPKLSQEFLEWREANVFFSLSKLYEMKKIIEYIKEDFLELNTGNKRIDAIWASLEMKGLNGRYEGILHRIRQSLRMLREYYAHLGDNIGIPIIPRAFQPLILALEAINGVLCVGAPGAGGFDALYCIMINHSIMKERLVAPINQYVKETKQQQPGINLSAEIMEVEQTSRGLKTERVCDFLKYFR